MRSGRPPLWRAATGFRSPGSRTCSTSSCSEIGPGGHHAINLLIHALDAALVFALLLAATRERLPSAFVAALFALHPLHVEVVAWVSERKELLEHGIRSAGGDRLRRVDAARWRNALCSDAARLRLRAGLQADVRDAAVRAAAARRAGRCAASSSVLRPGRGVLRSLARLILEKLPLFALSAAACVDRVRRAGAVALPGGRCAAAAARGPRRSRLRPLSRQAALAELPVDPLSAPVRPGARRRAMAGRGRRRGLGRARRRHRAAAARAAPSVPRRGLALVPRHARARDRARAGRPAGSGRPVHVRAARSGCSSRSRGARATQQVRSAPEPRSADRILGARARRARGGRRSESRARAGVARFREPVPRLARRHSAQHRPALQPRAAPGGARAGRGCGPQLRSGARDRSGERVRQRQSRKHPPARGATRAGDRALPRGAAPRSGRSRDAPEPRPCARVAR